MRAATCFSGIGAPEIAIPGWDWVWHAEIEPFPSAVMAHHHPGSVNLGDVLGADFLDRAKAMGPIDVMAGGPPCQGFSVAGLRGGMSDPRGNLTLRWVQILHAIQPRNAITENVPGWLSMPDNAFGCFLGALVGADDALRSPLDGKWPGVGMVAGPRARAAWRILDAQYFGVAQRRRRVFVVADFGDGADPAEVLFERAGLSGNPAPRREAGKRTAGTLAARTRGGGGLGTDFDLDGGLTAICNSGEADGAVVGSVSSKWSKGSGGPAGDECYNLIAHSLRAEGFDASEDGTGRGTPIVPVLFDDPRRFTNIHGGCDHGDLHPTLQSTNPKQIIALSSKDQGGDFVVQPEPIVIMERGRDGSSNLEHRQDGTANAILTPNGGRGGMGVGAIAFPERLSGTQYASTEDISPSLAALNPTAVAIQAGALAAEPGMKQQTYVQDAWAIRRLTPVECARLQGFPDTFLDITYRGKPAADGNKYKALGNSWAVPVGRWILERIETSILTQTGESK